MKLKKHLADQKTVQRAVLFMIGFGAIGTVMLLLTRAAAPQASYTIDPALGTRNSSASVASISGAYGSDAVLLRGCPQGQTGTPPNCTTPTPPPASGGGATGKFYIVGKDIIGPDGKVFVPFGGNVSMSIVRSWGVERPWVFDFGGVANGHSSQAQAWGWNAIRVTIVCDRTGDGYATPRELATSLTSIVNEYTAKKIVVIPECHDNTGTMLSYSGAGIDSHMAKVDEFWGYVMAEHKNNPYVWFNIVNEPTSDTGAASISYWTGLHNYYINKRNSLGAENIIIADLPNYGQGADALANQSFGTTLSASTCNLLYSWHAYGGLRGDINSNYDSWVQAIQNKNLPLFIGEYGFRIDGQDFVPGNVWLASGAELVATTDKVLSWNSSRGIGSTVWHGTGDSGGFITYSLLSNYTNYGAPGFYNSTNGSGLSPLGQKVWTAGRAQPARSTFSGNYKQSHCSSAP